MSQTQTQSKSQTLRIVTGKVFDVHSIFNDGTGFSCASVVVVPRIVTVIYDQNNEEVDTIVTSGDSIAVDGICKFYYEKMVVDRSTHVEDLNVIDNIFKKLEKEHEVKLQSIKNVTPIPPAPHDHDVDPFAFSASDIEATPELEKLADYANKNNIYVVSEDDPCYPFDPICIEKIRDP